MAADRTRMRQFREGSFISFSLLLTLLTACLSTGASGANDSTSLPFLRVSASDSIQSAKNFIEIKREQSWDRGGFKNSAIVRQGTLVAQPQESQVEFIQTNGTAEYEATYTFQPAEGKGIDDYSIVPVSSNGDVVASEDVGVSVVEIGGGAYNITTLFEFDGATGVTQFDLNFVDTETGVVVSSESSTFVVAGITFFYKDLIANRIQVGGDRQLTLFSQTAQTRQSTSSESVILETFVQYLDGSNSTEALNVDMSQIDFSFSGTEAFLSYDESSCRSDGGTYDGSAVSLPTGCDVGFSTNDVDGEYLGPQFGLRYSPAQNGTFTIGINWEGLVSGSDADIGSAGYETFLTVEVVKTTVTSGGGDTVTLQIPVFPDGAQESAQYQFALDLLFGGDATRQAVLTSSSVDESTGETNLVYRLALFIALRNEARFNNDQLAAEIMPCEGSVAGYQLTDNGKNGRYMFTDGRSMTGKVYQTGGCKDASIFSGGTQYKDSNLTYMGHESSADDKDSCLIRKAGKRQVYSSYQGMVYEAEGYKWSPTVNIDDIDSYEVDSGGAVRDSAVVFGITEGRAVLPELQFSNDTVLKRTQYQITRESLAEMGLGTLGNIEVPGSEFSEDIPVLNCPLSSAGPASRCRMSATFSEPISKLVILYAPAEKIATEQAAAVLLSDILLPCMCMCSSASQGGVKYSQAIGKPGKCVRENKKERAQCDAKNTDKVCEYELKESYQRKGPLGADGLYPCEPVLAPSITREGSYQKPSYLSI